MAAGLLEAAHRHTGFHLHTGTLRGIEQCRHQHAAVNAKAKTAWLPVVITGIEDHPALTAGAVQPADRRTQRGALGQQAQTLQHSQTGRLQEDAGAHRLQLFDPFQESNRITLTGEEYRRGETRGTRPYDGYRQSIHVHAPCCDAGNTNRLASLST